MTHDEAVKTIREALRVAAMWIPDDSSGDTKTLFKSIAALDSLASETEALRKRIAELESAIYVNTDCDDANNLRQEIINKASRTMGEAKK